MDIKKEYERWLANATADADVVAELKTLNDAKIEDAFYRDLAFGTGGLRGVIGAGTNRMNIYTVAKASQGLADYLKKNFETPSVAIGYDSRIKSDVFAKVAAGVFAANGVKVNIWPVLMPVPTVSFATRYLHTSAGVMVTASHNPSKYNGYKVYGADGCQITTEAAAEILADQSLQSGIVHIAASSLALRARILQVLARYRREYPHVRICLTNHSAPDGLAAVQNGLADFAILAKGASVPDSLSAQKIDEIQEIPICGSAFPELTKEAVSLQKLAEYPIISLIEGTSSHDFYAELFLRHDLAFAPDVEVETTAQVLPVVQSNLGVGFVPHEMLFGSPEESGIYPVTLTEPIAPRELYLYQRKTQPLSVAAKRLRQMLLDNTPQPGEK